MEAEDREIVGMVGLEKLNHEEGELRRMSVSKSARKQGIGTLLVRKLESYAREIGLKRVILTTLEAFKPAISLYQTLGYRLVSSILEESVGSNVVGFQKDLDLDID